MSHAIITPAGAAALLVQELSELDIQARQRAPDWVEATLKEEELRKIHLRSQLATRVLKLAGTTTTENLAALASTIKPKGSFAVRASGEDTQIVQEDVGAAIHDASGAKVDLERPEELVYCYQSAGEWLLGIDCLGDLHKRHYKIMNSSQSLSGPVAAAILRLSGWTPKHDLLVWPCGTAEMAVEAALWASKKSPRAYELKELESSQPTCSIIAADPSLAMVRLAEKNAKVAGIHPYIRFSRQDADWLDTKHNESSIQYCLGVLPNLKLHPKLAKEIFYQLDYILGQGGTCLFVCVNDESAAALEEQAVSYTIERLHVWQGKKALSLVKAKRRKTNETP